MLHEHTPPWLASSCGIHISVWSKCKAGGPSGCRQYYTVLTRRWSQQPPALPPEITLYVPHRFSACFFFLQAQLPPRSFHADNVSDMPVRRDMDLTPFSAPVDRESCWQAAAERQSSVCPFEAQRTLKEQHKQIRVQQRGPSRNYWRCNVLVMTIRIEEFSFVITSSQGSSLVGFKKNTTLRHSYVRTYLTRQSQALLIMALSHKRCLFCSSYALTVQKNSAFSQFVRAFTFPVVSTQGL